MSPRRFRMSWLVIAFVATVAIALTSCFMRRGRYYLNEGNQRSIITGLVPADAKPAHRNGEEAPASPESFTKIVENDFVAVSRRPLSTFSSDVDTASYSIVRKFLNDGNLPPEDAVRIEELVNYFRYEYRAPTNGQPVALSAEMFTCPWNKDHLLLRIGVQAQRIAPEEMPPRNFAFLIDVSGSMSGSNRLPLVKKSLAYLVEHLTERDRVAIVTYAGDAGLALASTPGHRQGTILKAIQKLEAGGSTNGSGGIQRAYREAEEHFIAGGVNRVILATDGDFNVGITDQDELVKLIEQKRKTGIYLTLLGYGMDNLKDSTLEKLAHHGNGHYAYIDSEREAKRLFADQGAALTTVAKDVKLQVEFNPQYVSKYRLIGYENRLLKDKDFNDDRKDAGDMGSGHTVTALYELVPAKPTGVDPLKYQTADHKPEKELSLNEWLTAKLRYKDPESDKSELITFPVTVHCGYFDASTDSRFAASVAAFGMLLRDSRHKGSATYAMVQELAHSRTIRAQDPARAEFLQLVKKAERLQKRDLTARVHKNDADDNEE